MTKQNKADSFARLRDWLENGGSALDGAMQEALEEDISPALPQEPAPPAKDKNKALSKDHRTYRMLYAIAAAVMCAALIGILIFAALRMPQFGKKDAAADSQVPDFYVEHTLEETGAMNIVTGIILDYRGFDTLGESHVLFIGVCTVLLILSIRGERNEKERLAEEEYDQHFEPRHDVILQSAARILTPLTLVFGLYIILNGHLSPGGGFSGGAVLGAGLILYQNAFGYQKIERFFTYRTFQFVSLFALLFYSLAKGYHFLTGANHLENGIPIGVAGRIFSAGLLLPLNMAVGCVVACTMYALYTMFRKGDF